MSDPAATENDEVGPDELTTQPEDPDPLELIGELVPDDELTFDEDIEVADEDLVLEDLA